MLSAVLAACTPKAGSPSDNPPAGDNIKTTTAPTSDPVTAEPTAPDTTGTEPAATGITEPEPTIAESENTPAEWNPDITFLTTDFDLFSWDDTCFAKAKLTMINLWAYWCGPCVRELPEINKLSEEYADKGVQIFGLTYPEEEADNRATVKELGLTYQMLFYTGDFDKYMDSGYLPTTVFIDSNGHVIGEPIIGSQSYEEWKELIEEYLAR